jgi:hypothetical protein
MNFEIKVECKGSAVGTLGWLNEKLAKTELVIKKTSTGVLGMFGKEENPENPEKPVYNFITKIAPNTYANCEAYHLETVSKTHLLSTNMYENEYEFGYFNVKLTPAAENVAKEFLEKACAAFVNYWESDSIG